MFSSDAAVVSHQTCEYPQGGWRDAAAVVFGTDLKCDLPLLHQHAVPRAQRRSRMVDVGGFGRDAVQFDDLETTAFAKRIETAVHSHIEPAEVEAIEAPGNFIEAILKRRTQYSAAVEEHRTAAMR